MLEGTSYELDHVVDHISLLGLNHAMYRSAREEEGQAYKVRHVADDAIGSSHTSRAGRRRL